jgi:hypothetical protein
LGVKQAEGEVDGSADDAVVVVVNLACVHGHPQSDSFLGTVDLVVRSESRNDALRKRVDKEAFRDGGWDQDEDTIASIFVFAVIPWDAGFVERRDEDSVQAVPHRDLVESIPTEISEALHVYSDYGAMP